MGFKSQIEILTVTSLYRTAVVGEYELLFIKNLFLCKSTCEKDTMHAIKHGNVRRSKTGVCVCVCVCVCIQVTLPSFHIILRHFDI